MSKEYDIAVIPGDGTGPEVINEGIKVLKAVESKFGIKFKFVYYPYGAEHYLKTGETLPDSAISEFKDFDAIYLGAVGDPRVKTGILERGLLLKLRFDLDLYINLRPAILYEGVWTPLKDKGPEHINFTVIRENTEGLYAGAGGFLYKGTKNEVATQEMICTRHGTERVIRYAFEYARKYGREKKLTMVGKTNVLTYAHDLWARVFEEVSKEYPDIKTDYAHVDATCMWMVKNPEWFDVIVTDNMFGDIITDLAAIIQGGLGVAAGGNINPNGVSMFEPMGGSAPKYTGKNVINPIAAIEAGRLMLRFLKEEEASQKIQEAVKKTVKQMKSMNAGQMGFSTTEVGDMVANYVLND
ncbi:MAG: 3-isopropylmalate dehydrogenase [Brevinematia bacterium]